LFFREKNAARICSKRWRPDLPALPVSFIPESHRLTPKEMREHREEARRKVEAAAYRTILEADDDVPGSAGEISPYLTLFHQFF